MGWVKISIQTANQINPTTRLPDIRWPKPGSSKEARAKKILFKLLIRWHQKRYRPFFVIEQNRDIVHLNYIAYIRDSQLANSHLKPLPFAGGIKDYFSHPAPGKRFTLIRVSAFISHHLTRQCSTCYLQQS